ncbi:MAG: L,D-transpeptidase [Lachnospiraceae bacterium]|nr:L,D-transpeptidase [Lachnospiraceae bacterium]
MKKKKLTLVTAFWVFVFAFLHVHSIDANAAGGYTIYVNRKTNIINVINSKNGKLVRAMYCSTGRNYQTLKGSYRTVRKYRWHALYHNSYGQYCTRIHGSYLFHSVPYYGASKNKVSTEGYNKLGEQASAGCIRLAVTDAKWIYDHCRVGTKVVIGESKKLKKPSRPKLKISTKKKTGWDPTDPDPHNPYRPVLTLKKGASTKIPYGSNFNVKEKISVSSKFTSRKTLLKHTSVKGKVNTEKPGTYKVTCTLTDPNTTLKVKKTFTFKVGKKPAGTTEEKNPQESSEITQVK